jgi:4-amino-4-deoxy-L-arabinose transferase-like glycosyltransferase
MTDERAEAGRPRWDVILACVVVVLAATRLALQPLTPPGFFVDEAAGGAHIQAMLASGADAHGEHWPLFTEALGGGYTTPVYLYPATGWARVFGAGQLSLRYFSQFATLLGIALLALGARYWLGRRFALLTAVVALALPWGWVQGSIAWDPALAPPLACAAFLSWSVLLFSARTGHRRLAFVGLPAALVGLAYVYPPCRVGGPLLFLAGYAWLYRRRALPMAGIATSCAFAAVLALPLAQFMREPGALGRSEALSVFSGGNTVGEGLVRLADNLWLLLSPVFLFVQGDANLRHSTTRQGMLGVASVLPVLAVLLYAGRVAARRRDGAGPQGVRPPLLGAAVVGVAAAYLGSALTNEGHPHSLRATAAWPFFALLVALGWYLILEHGRRLAVVAAAVFALGTSAYAIDLAARYPERASSAFDEQMRDRILRGEKVTYPELAQRYYRQR